MSISDLWSERKDEPKFEYNQDKSWVGFDLDGSIAEYYEYDPNDPTPGKPIEKTISLLKSYLDSGIDCRIFTARADFPEDFDILRDWFERAGLPRDLVITNVKDVYCKMIFDDRAIQVERNTGNLLGDPNTIEEIFE